MKEAKTLVMITATMNILYGDINPLLQKPILGSGIEQWNNIENKKLKNKILNRKWDRSTAWTDYSPSQATLF